MKTREMVRILSIASALAAIGVTSAGAGSILVADAGDVFSFATDGAIHRIHDSGEIETVLAGAPLRSPAAIIPWHGNGNARSWLVSDLGFMFVPFEDGEVLLVGEDGVTVVFSGPPLDDPFGLLRRGDDLYVADFGKDAIFKLALDPDGDGEAGPFPLGPEAVTTVIEGPPLAGPNQLLDWKGDGIMFADDSGQVYVFDLADPSGTLGNYGPGFADPVGLARANVPASSSVSGPGVVVVDAALQQVHVVDNKGETAALVMAQPLGQLLGADAGAGGKVAVANAGNLFSPDGDGEVLVFDRGSVAVAYSGPPLVNPFSVRFVPGN